MAERRLRVMAAVALGGMLGASARWGLSVALAGSGGWPWSTWLANVAGSFLIGLFAAMLLPDGRWRLSPAARQFWLTGVFGGFTTFSLFSLEMLAMLQVDAWGLAGGYLLASLAGWLLAVLAGFSLGQRLNAAPRLV